MMMPPRNKTLARKALIQKISFERDASPPPPLPLPAKLVRSDEFLRRVPD